MKLYSTYVFMCTTSSMYIFMASKHTSKDIIICKHCKMKLYSTYVFMCTTSSMYIFMASKHTSKDIIICKHCKMKLYSMYLCVQLHQCIYLWLQSIHISKDGLQITFIWLFVCTYSTYVFMCTTSSMYLCLFKRWIANYIYMTICVCIFYILCIYGYAAIHILVYHNM